MRVNYVKEKTKRSFEISDMRGVDLTASPINVSKNRASYMKNMISEGGTNHKRHGFSSVVQYLDIDDKPMRINGMHVYYGTDGEKLIIHAGDSFFYEDGTKILCSRAILDKRSQGFYINEKLYIVGCGGILVYDGEKLDGIEPYIPLVMTGGDYRFNTTKTIDGVNLLTTKRKMKLDGTSFIENESGQFKFDASTDFSKDVTINIKISVGNNDIRLQQGAAPNPDVDYRYTTSDIDVTFKITPDIVEQNRENGSVKDFSVGAEAFTVNGKKLYVFTDNSAGAEGMAMEDLTCKIKGGCTLFEFNFNSMPTEENGLNISLEYESENDNSEQISGCSFGAIIGDDNNSARLIISGNDKAPNMCYVSDSFHMEGCAFFPDVNYIAVGDSRPVTAFLRLSDASLGIFKEKGFYRYEFEFLADSQTFVTSLKMSGFKSADTVGCISPYTALNVNSDSLVFTGDNVCGVVNSALDSSVERYLRVRSSRIEKAFKKYGKESLKNAVGCEYDGRYYLFIDGDAYIGDTRYKTYESNKLDSSYEYEWWVWDKVNARCVAVCKDKMYIGTDTGHIRKENEEYRDIGIIKTTRGGDVLYNSADGSFTINGDIDIEEGSKVCLKGVRSWLDDVAYTKEAVDGTEWLTVTVKPKDMEYVKDGQELLLFKSDGSGEEYREVAYITVLPGDELFYKFRISDRDGSPISEITANDEIHLVYVYEDGTTEFNLVADGDKYYICDRNDNIVRWDMPYGAEPMLTIFTAENVCAVYHTPMLDMGTAIQTKTLYKIALTAGVKDIGYIKVGYETHKNDKLDIKGVSALNFSKLNFNYLTFDLNFAKTYAVRVFERNFNFLMIRIESNDNMDISVESINLIYVLNNLITGVR